MMHACMLHGDIFNLCPLLHQQIKKYLILWNFQLNVKRGDQNKRNVICEMRKQHSLFASICNLNITRPLLLGFSYRINQYYAATREATFCFSGKRWMSDLIVQRRPSRTMFYLEFDCFLIFWSSILYSGACELCICAALCWMQQCNWLNFVYVQD